MSANRVDQFSGPEVTTALAGAIGERQSFMTGAVLMALMAAAWLPLRRLAASVIH